MRGELPGVDLDRVVRMCLVHDFGEAVTGDIPSFRKTGGNVRDEARAVARLLAELPAPQRDELSALFAERVQALKGGPRNLAAALEAIHLCAATRAVQEPSFRKAFKLPAPKEVAILAKLDTKAGLFDPNVNVPITPGKIVDPPRSPKK